MITFKKRIKEGLNLVKKHPFEQLVIKYNPEKRETSTYGYEWEFPIEAYDDLINAGYTWTKRERITNNQHPNYGKSYVSVDMFHGPDSGIKHLVREGLNLRKQANLAVGDRVKILPTAPAWDVLTDIARSAEYIVHNIKDDGMVSLINNGSNFTIDVFPADVDRIDRSWWVKKRWEDMEKLSEGLNLPKLNLDTPEGWFKNLLSQMDQVTIDSHIYFKLNNEIYMKYNKETGNLWYSYDNIYLVLEDKFWLNYEQMNELIKGIVETNTNLGPVTPAFGLL